MDVELVSHDVYKSNSMGKTLSPKCKQCRREGIKLYLKGERCYTTKCPIVKRNYPPGMHGSKGRNKLTSYGIQLREKQKAKRYYGILEKQFALYYEKAFRKKGETAENLLHMLESRIDNVVSRVGLGKSHAQARQIVNHGHMLLNGKKVTIPSIQMKPGDILEVAASSKKEKYFETVKIGLEKVDVPAWISFDPDQLKIKYNEHPTVENVAPIFDLKYVVEF